MHIHKTSRLAAAIALATALSACGAGGNGDGSNGGGGGTGPEAVADCIEEKKAQGDGTLTEVEALLCVTEGTVTEGAQDVVDAILNGSALTDILDQIDALLPEELAELLEMLQSDDALGPLLVAVNGILAALNAGGDPTEIANVLQDLLGGLGGDTGGESPLGPLGELSDLLGGGGEGVEDLLGALASGDPAAIADALQGLLGGLGGDGGSGGDNAGLIDSVESLVANLSDDTALAQLQDVVSQLAGADEGALAAITGPLNDLTADQLVALTDLVNQLAVDEGSPVGEVVSVLNDALTQLTGGNPADGLGGLGDLLAGGLGGGDGGGTGDAGLIDSVESLVANLSDDTALAQLQDVVSQLAGADEGALAAITGPLNDLTADQLVALTDLVNQLAVDEGSPVGEVVGVLNDALTQLTGGNPADGLGGLGDLLSGGLGGLLGG